MVWTVDSPGPDTSAHILVVEVVLGEGDGAGGEPNVDIGDYRGADVQSPLTINNLHRDRTYQITVEIEDTSSEEVLQRITLDVCTGELKTTDRLVTTNEVSIFKPIRDIVRMVAEFLRGVNLKYLEN